MAFLSARYAYHFGRMFLSPSKSFGGRIKGEEEMQETSKEGVGGTRESEGGGRQTEGKRKRVAVRNDRRRRRGNK